MSQRKNGLAFKHISQKRIPSLGLVKSIPAGSRHKTEPEQLSDAEIIQCVLGGEVDCYEHLLNRYKNRVFGIVSKHVPSEDIEEIAHEAFIRAFKSLPTFRQESEFKYWLSAIAVRTCHDYWRSRYRSREVAVSGLSERHQEWLSHTATEASTASFSEEISRKETAEILRWALGQLPEKDRIVLELVYLQEHTIKEAAQLLGWKQTTVKVRSFRSRRKLQKILEDVMKPDSGGL